MHACGANSSCASWQYTAGKCTLNTDLPESAHATGSHCGVKSAGWSTTGDRALTYVQRPDGVGPNPSVGDFTLSGSASSTEQMISVHTGDDLAKIYSDWKTGVPDRLPAGQPQTQLASHGALSVNIVVPPRSTGTASAIFAWYFEDRNYRSHGVNNIYGNYYQHLFKDSAAAAAALASEAALESVAADINAHHRAVAHPDNPTPVWLKDMLVNQFSHFHMIMRFKDGRIREYEAWSCDDVDSVHNDYQRHLPYIWMVPEFERQKLTAWGTWAMMKDGHVAECLGSFGHGPMDVPTGRVMGDTTSLFVLELYELWRHTGDEAFVKPLYPSVQRAVAWMIANSAQGDYNLPQRLQTTYDHFGFDRQRAVVYNAHIYLAAMQAASALAEHFDDATTLAAVANATAHTKVALMDPVKLWNSTSNFFRATDAAGANQIFTDSLYGQMLSHHHFGNFTLPDGILASHLRYEWARNEDTYGMRVLNDPIQEDSVWMCGNFDIIFGPFIAHAQLQPTPHCPCTVVSLLSMLIGS